MTHTMYDAFDTGIQASTVYVKNHFHYSDPNDVNLKYYSLEKVVHLSWVYKPLSVI